MADFQKALDLVLKREGGYQLTDDPDDPGGRTYAGISEKANPDWEGWEQIDAGARLDGSYLRNWVRDLYLKKYWNPLELEKTQVDQHCANILFSCAVLSGVGTALLLKRLLYQVEHPRDAATGMTLMRIARYSRLVDRNPKLAKYFRGWVNRALDDYAEAP